MTTRTIGRGWASPPLVVQILALLMGALVVAQLVTLLLTLVLPPEPPRRYVMADIAAALRGEHSGRPLERHLQAGPPDLAARGWLVSPTTTAQLARAVGLPADRVVFGFYTELPVGGMIGPPPPPPQRLPADARPTRGGPPLAAAVPSPHPVARLDRSSRSAPLLALVAPVAMAGGQVTAPPLPPMQPPPGGIGGQPSTGAGRAVPGSGFPGAGFPGGGFPGGGMPGAGRPEGGFPRATLPGGLRGRGGVPDITVARDPRTQQPVAVQLDRRGVGQGAAVQLGGSVNLRAGQEQAGGTPTTGDSASAAAATAGRVPPAVALDRREPGNGVRGDRPFTPLLPVRSPPMVQPTTTSSPARPAVAATRAPVPIVQPRAAEPARTVATRPSPAAAITPSARPSPAARPAPVQPVRTAAPPRPDERPVPIVRPSTGLFGLSAAPFVEGDFIAAARTADGRWAVVSPAPEGFPNAWQARVLLWFGLSLLCVAPIAWAFARRIVGPLQGFARAAEMLGRDPSAAILPLEGPAEVGRAAHAFNQMQSRLRSFVDDRTAMIGAISHDLRTPLTRLRFRIEDVPDEQHDGLLGEITAMEAMISSVIAYMHDAATPGVRERRDMAELVGDVVEDAALIGGDVRTVQAEPAPVDIDALGIRRVLDNLLTNAIKYGGGTARVALHVEDACAVADIVDDGPGIPEAEIERVFEPFYRSEAARSSQREGSGLGLAVCRSIARAHGGDVRLFRSPQGFTARVTLPLAYDGERQLAA